MENWYALHLMSRQIQRERQLEARKLRQVQQFRKFDMKNSKANSEKKRRRFINFIGKSFESFGKALQKKSQIC